MQYGLFTRVEHHEKHRTHDQRADGKQQQDAGELAEHVLETRHRLCENRIDGAILDVLRDESRGRDNGTQRSKDRHRAKRDIFQNLEFLLKSEARHEDRTADQKQREDE